MRRATRPRAGERGSVSAEFAASLPAVVLVLAVCLGALQVGGMQVRLQDAAADAARIVARGDSLAAAAARVERAAAGVDLAVTDEGELVCATLTGSVAVAGLFSLPVGARSCALAGGR
ncbi:hypothetical protein GCM10011490_20900 [Pseudoclavibacter endophyticus]|uniref:TadE family type IV pilus minor pilin n=1 Tax=Pseudoclavibacter endophyticus TaxID=1778590 RepID=UPI001993C9C1|nr:TadE family type IV pilus minor pilin [Pseudoclavibacter endophyticus]GGA70091.1 hypothetical protein GCM10011490_20900 [Pseudoclavibacter endophyticus]